MRSRRNTEYSRLLGWRCDVIPPAAESDAARLLRRVSEVSADAIILTAFHAGGSRRDTRMVRTDSQLFGTPSANDRYRWTTIACGLNAPSASVERVRDGLIIASGYCDAMRELLSNAGVVIGEDQNVPDGITHLYIPSMSPLASEPPYLPPDRRIDQLHQS